MDPHALFCGNRPSRFLALCCLFAMLVTAAFAGPNRVTILTDAFGLKQGLELDWGYSALVEFNGHRILFDAGNNAAIFQRNIARMKVDLTHLTAIVISHAHGDHTAGLRWVLSLNPGVPLYVPDDIAFRGQEVPRPFFTTNPDPSLPPMRRYYGGQVPEHVAGWQVYNDTNLTVVKKAMTIMPGVGLVTAMAQKPPFLGLSEVSLVLDTPNGKVVIAGCSHPSIEKIMAEAASAQPTAPIYMLFGGLHLVTDTHAQIAQTLETLANQYHVQKMAVGHCTSEAAFTLIHSMWGSNDLYAGLGETIEF